MPHDHRPTRTPVENAGYDTFVVNLRNAHALEKQVIAVLEAQLKQVTAYPDLHLRLTQHLAETHHQVDRLQATLEACGEAPSLFKDTLLSVMGISQSSMQGLSDDAVLKAIAADTMTEHLEIATYRSLILLARLAGRPELCAQLEESLQEELAMAAWFDQNLDQITRRYIEMKAADQAPPANPAPRADNHPHRPSNI
ncbi:MULTISPECIES: ferritin-like domain-containing protein [unclassified Yoonia]|uniref:ferritin-like domain-containing protein n=1 Tax=unclassified Yoonia TaxID=2629118 RepID=UPI002AFF219D|nr:MULTISPECIES: ferritin-like domain-containing protein [unclassified Yoonia]